MNEAVVGRPIATTDRISNDDARFYSEIDGLRVIEELLYFKGLEVVDKNGTIPFKLLEDVAHIHYRLKKGATNKLYVGYFLDRYYRRRGLKTSATLVSVPREIIDKVKAEELRYQPKENVDE